MCVCIYIFLPPPLGLSIGCILHIIQAQHSWHFAPLTLCCGVSWSRQVPARCLFPSPTRLPWPQMSPDTAQYPVGDKTALGQEPLFIFQLGCFLFFNIELHELFVYFGDKSLVSCFICMFSPSLKVVFVSHLWFFVFCFFFAVQKLLSLIRPLFLFLFSNLEGGSKKILLWFMSKSVLPVFSCNHFILPKLMNLFTGRE